MTITAIRTKLYDYILIADSKKLHALYNLLENDMEVKTEWWKDEQFMDELDRRDQALESGEDKGVTLEEMMASIDKLRAEKYEKQLLSY
jgi:3-phenylpropionate/cinnamic acid dioxygenase small subunit